MCRKYFCEKKQLKLLVFQMAGSLLCCCDKMYKNYSMLQMENYFLNFKSKEDNFNRDMC